MKTLDNTDLTQFDKGILKSMRLEGFPVRMVLVIEHPSTEQPQTIEVYPGFEYRLHPKGMLQIPVLMASSPDAPQPIPQETEELEKDWVDGG